MLCGSQDDITLGIGIIETIPQAETNELIIQNWNELAENGWIISLFEYKAEVDREIFKRKHYATAQRSGEWYSIKIDNNTRNIILNAQKNRFHPSAV